MVFLRRTMMIGKAQDTGGHPLSGASGVRRFQIKPGDANMFAVVKLVRGKRKVLERAEKFFVAPSRSAGAKIGFGHKLRNSEMR